MFQISLEICTCVSKLHMNENFSFPPSFLPGRLARPVLPAGFVSLRALQQLPGAMEGNSSERKSPDWDSAGEASHACEHSQPPRLLGLSPPEGFLSLKLLLA